VLYDYKRVAAHLDKSILSGNRDLTIWRYRALLPIEPSSRVPPLSVGWTPVYECRALADQYRVRQILIKDDGRNPTASFKDRPSALAAVKACELGAHVVTTASSGNAGIALAAMCSSLELNSVIFVPAASPAAKIVQLQVYGATVVLVEGSYDQAYDLCLEAGRRYGWYQRSTGYNPFMTEGKKTAAFEIAEQLNWDIPDRVIVGMGDGCIIGGLWKGFSEFYRLGFIERQPRLMGVQAEGAAAIVDAAQGDGKVRPRQARTIADGICVGKPRDAAKAIRALRESGGSGITVSDDEIIAAIARLAQTAGVFAEPAAAAAFAGFVKLRDSGAIGPDERVLLVITGSGLKDIESARRTVKKPLCIPPDINALLECGSLLPL
jgi:threonine synthase